MAQKTIKRTGLLTTKVGWVGFFGNGQTIANPTTAADVNGTVKAATEWLDGSSAPAKAQRRAGAFVYNKLDQTVTIVSRSLIASFQAVMKEAVTNPDQVKQVFAPQAVAGMVPPSFALESITTEQEKPILVLRRKPPGLDI